MLASTLFIIYMNFVDAPVGFHSGARRVRGKDILPSGNLYLL